MVGHVVAPGEAGLGRRRGEAVEKRVHAREVEVAVAPGQGRQRLESCFSILPTISSGNAGRSTRGTESAVAHAAAGAAGDLRRFLGRKGADRVAVEFGQRGKGHVVDIHVEAHADRVRGNISR